MSYAIVEMMKSKYDVQVERTKEEVDDEDDRNRKQKREEIK